MALPRSVRLVQTLKPGVVLSVRALHMTSTIGSASLFETAVNEIPKTTRSLTTAPTPQTPIDYIYMPSLSSPSPNPSAEIQTPRLYPRSPTSSSSSSAQPSSAEDLPDTPVHRSSISLLSGAPLYDEAIVSAMSEVADNGAVEMDVFDLTAVVERAKEGGERMMEGAREVVADVVGEGAGNSVAASGSGTGSGAKTAEGEEEGALRRVWKGVVEDVFGGEKG